MRSIALLLALTLVISLPAQAQTRTTIGDLKAAFQSWAADNPEAADRLMGSTSQVGNLPDDQEVIYQETEVKREGPGDGSYIDGFDLVEGADLSNETIADAINFLSAKNADLQARLEEAEDALRSGASICEQLAASGTAYGERAARRLGCE